MAARKEKSKEAKIKSEKTRLKGIFKDLDENKKKLVTPLIEKAAFMSITPAGKVKVCTLRLIR